MMIRVKYPGGTTAMVRPLLLKQLINSEKISEFRRSEGWVMVGQDRVRGRKRIDYLGEERRQAV